ncbi:preprotein translocase subunit YajC [Lapidilactobacillus wuchangensis]|uniref:preprotein translocase subunit YajC n=1 Tax=Lapidilactobacillus wuchangensis TaxID=2486001 RepID=UPI002989F005|nr:preprotein translocase subunit YajC [Lapidilactobacillus wuchangensis]
MSNLILAAQTNAGMGGNFSFLIIIILMFVVMYFTMIRPGKKQQNQRKTMLDGMKKGDRIVTIGGLHGVIDSIDTTAGTVVVDADGIFLTFNRTAIRDVHPAEAASETPVAEPKEETHDASSETTVGQEPASDDKKSDDADQKDDQK